MKKAQFEIMGLAIVMVILSVAVFFLISLSLSDPGDDLAGEFLTEQFAQNTLDAFLKSSHPAPGCGRYSVSDHYVWIATNSGPPECVEQQYTDQLSSMIAQAAQYRGLEYRFQVRQEVCDNPLGSGCTKLVDEGSASCDPTTRNVGRAGRQTLPKDTGGSNDMELVLWLCAPQ